MDSYIRKQRLPCVKGKVTVYVTCQCSENRCLWRVIDKAPRCVAWSQFYSTDYKRIMHPINSLLGLCRKIVLAVISHISLIRDNADHIKQTPLLKFVAGF